MTQAKTKKTKSKPSPAQVDAEKGGCSCWPQSSSGDRVESFLCLGEKVQCGDFGDEWQPGTVVKPGRQKSPKEVSYDNTQFTRDAKPKVRPDDWEPSATGEGYTWDIIVDKNRNQRQQSQFNDAKHLPLAFLVIIGILAWGFLDFAENVVRMIEIMGNPDESIAAFDLAKLGNDTISIILCLLVYLLWSSLCFKFVHIRHIWSWKPWIFNSQSMMPGGFIPRPSAVSLGLLMFLSSVFISERVAGGAALFARNDDGSYKNNVGHGEWCRADVREESHYQDDWFSRLDRLTPSGCFLGTCPEHSLDPGCKASGTPLSPLLFNTALNASGMPHPNIVHPYQRTSHISLTIYQGLQGMFPSVLGHMRPDDSVSIDEGNTCMYQCVKWRAYGFNDIVAKVGTIGAGNAIVTRMTESATSYLGKKAITADTTPEELRKLLARARPDRNNFFYKRFHKSAAVPAIIFAFLRIFLSFFVYKIDDHGFFTVDYYVSQVLLFAISASIICRKYNVFRWEAVLYCDNLWTRGSEQFIIPDSVDGDATSAKPKTVDLLVWLHMSFEERAYLLIHFARKVTTNPKGVIGLPVQCFMEQTQEVSVLGQARTKESRIVLIKRQQNNDRWPQGHIVKMKDGMAHVQWDDEHICADLEDDDGVWLDSLKKGVNECTQCLCKERKGLPCKNCEKYCQATTTPVDPMLLFDMSPEWDKVLAEFVGKDDGAVDAVRGKVLWRIQRNKEDEGASIRDNPSNKRRPEWDSLLPVDKKKKVKKDEATKRKQEQHFMKHRDSIQVPNLAWNSNAQTALLSGTN